MQNKNDSLKRMLHSGLVDHETNEVDLSIQNPIHVKEYYEATLSTFAEVTKLLDKLRFARNLRKTQNLELVVWLGQERFAKLTVVSLKPKQ